MTAGELLERLSLTASKTKLRRVGRGRSREWVCVLQPSTKLEK
jgi:hypothetical protein